MHKQAQNTDIHVSSMNEFIHEDTRPGVFYSPSAEDLQELCRLYEGCVGQPLNCASAAILEQWFERMEPALIREAVIRTGIYAKRPGAAYIRAILKNWADQGIYSMNDLTQKEQKRAQAKSHEASMAGNWWNYQQHSYSESDFDNIFLIK